ncbi:DUF4321 domain-containing protein [Biomaibacter acetigenes]|jgi:hypothetical protein|uniref:DUF4321 domain-containing protein n=1 Tax=Biomaibacter acetigenes TaxID=2316383 RepID=A0A3G2R6A8_9FIRM|nr:DUF4321 domain-containing protein [Biomaibacter acetigenes]AYO30982.1 DUF4321 domain-containing protein [Biomaibacter acetigenes]MDN5302457.1 hypothetical protein [Thermoanaerobacteraceae bacterium]MDN5311041.1 hypothetical protein [Thermoanaerobacteraceae bacterium]RKL63942.1 DUF4321 domain-containing protein [Thermoanaerobacteraceae bacterium SP2]
MKRNYRSTALLVIILLVGLVIGGVLGQVLGKYVPLLAYGKSIGLSPTKLDMGIATMTFGFNINLNLAAAVGLIIGILLYQRM